MAKDKTDNKNIPENKQDIAYAEFQNLVTGLSLSELKRLKSWINDPHTFAEDLVPVIPITIQRLLGEETISTDNLLPIVEVAIEESVHKNPQKLADVLFPIMGPAIRKAVAEDVKKMIASINTTLENSFSVKRLQWRVQSVVTGRNFTEIVLVNSMVYRVRQVFLIHKDSGLLIQHEVDETENIKDPDMVSAMLTAINDFVKDSFDGEQDNDLESIQVGSYQVWIERGPHAIIAGIVEGIAPDELREVFKQSIESIHLQFASNLISFDGDTSTFDQNRNDIKLCLQKQEKKKKEHKPYPVIFLGFLILCVIGYFSYLGIDSGYRWRKYIKTLNEEPGIVVTKSSSLFGQKSISGIHDPLAIDPTLILTGFDFSQDKVKSNWKMFLSAEKEIIIKRAKKKLAPGDLTLLCYDNGILYLSGSAEKKWLKKALNIYPSVLGVDTVNIEELNKDKDRPDITSYIPPIEEIALHFEYGDFELSTEKLLVLDSVAILMKEIIDFAGDDNFFAIRVVGFTHDYKKVIEGKRVSIRTEVVYRRMLDLGVDNDFLRPDLELFRKETMQDLTPRSITFDVIVLNECKND